MSDRISIVKELTSLTIQKAELEKLIEEADAFTSKGLLNIDVSIPFKSGPYEGHTWAEVYHGMVKNRITIKALQEQINNLQFDLECLNLLDKSLACVVLSADGRSQACLSVDEVRLFRKSLGEVKSLTLDTQASQSLKAVEIDLDL